VLFCLFAKEARTQPGECGALVVIGHISSPRYRLRPLPVAPLVVRRRYLALVPTPLPRCSSQALNRGAQAAARGAAQVRDSGAQAVARGAARCFSQLLDSGAHAVAPSAARCASQALDHGV
jgi:hypothetical protein